MAKKIRSMGKILLDLEPLLEEIVDDHELQRGEVLHLVEAWLRIHRPDCIEEYLDGSHPEFYYGPERKVA